MGDVTPGDGLREGSCDGGPRNGLSCDVSGQHAFPSFGDTSFDCPPPPGSQIAALKIDLRSTTGPRQVTVVAASPQCTAGGWGSFRCLTDTCAEPGMPACFTDADCATGTCGGKRCIGGGDDGTPCTLNSQCSSNICSRPGQPTQVNSCWGGAGDCVPDSVFDEGFCASGPLDQLCAIETFRACFADTDCPAAGDSCTGGKLRDCYTLDETAAGDADVWGIGQGCGPHQNDLCGATTASFFAAGPLNSAAVNSARGLPGLGRVLLPRTAGGLPQPDEQARGQSWRRNARCWVGRP